MDNSDWMSIPDSTGVAGPTMWCCCGPGAYVVLHLLLVVVAAAAVVAAVVVVVSDVVEAVYHSLDLNDCQFLVTTTISF